MNPHPQPLALAQTRWLACLTLCNWHRTKVAMTLLQQAEKEYCAAFRESIVKRHFRAFRHADHVLNA